MVNPMSFQITKIDGVAADDMGTIRDLLEVWQKKYPRNVLRSAYFDAKNRFKDFGISIPPKIRSNVKSVVGWPAKAVRSLADLSVWNGLSFTGDDSLGLQALAVANHFDEMIPQIIQSAYKHSCAFLTVTRGDAGEPSIKFTPRAADWSAAIWDKRNYRLKSALTITDTDDNGDVTGFVVYLRDKIIECVRELGRWKVISDESHSVGRVPVVPILSDPQLDRPLGRSRITRPLMGLTDMGYRTLVRMESNAEFYSAPRVWFLGLEPEALGDDKWTSLISQINSVSRDENAEIPSMHQVSQASMQPQSDMLKTIALMVASETDLPVNDLGITMDNPPSAEAMAAAERKLSRNAERQNKIFGRAIEDALRIAARSLDSSVTDDVLSSFRCEWAATREDSAASRADAYAKVASVNPAYGTSEVGLRALGLSYSEIEQVMSEQRRSNASSLLATLTASTQAAADGNAE